MYWTQLNIKVKFNELIASNRSIELHLLTFLNAIKLPFIIPLYAWYAKINLAIRSYIALSVDVILSHYVPHVYQHVQKILNTFF